MSDDIPEDQLIILEDGKRIKYNNWVSCGIGKVRRDALDHDDPRHTYNFIKAKGLVPENYGIKDPFVEMVMLEFSDYSRYDLIKELIMYRRVQC